MNLLIVDDDVITVDVISGAVEWEKLDITNVSCAYNIEMAKHFLSTKEMFVVICDVEMPQGTGLDLLKWAKQSSVNCEFIFLTNHEKFEFVTTALQFDAISYVLKPFDAENIVPEVVKAIAKLNEKNKLLEYSRYGSYWLQNRSSLEQQFWEEIIFKKITSDKDVIKIEMEKRNLTINNNARFFLLLSSVYWSDELKECWGKGSKGVFEYGLRKITAEMLLDKLTTEHIVNYSRFDIIYTVCVIEETNYSNEAVKRCEDMIKLCKEKFSCVLSCYISDSVEIDKLASTLSTLEGWDKNNIDARGTLLDKAPYCEENPECKFISLHEFEEKLIVGDKLGIMQLIKNSIETMSNSNNLDLRAMKILKESVIQVVYSHLYSKGIAANELLGDSEYYLLSELASRSIYDMMKWQNYLINKVVEYEKDLKKVQPIIEQAEEFIKQNYMHDIGRNEVAKTVFLAPEYFAKLFKKETERSINEYIHDVRIDKAKQLLRSTNLSIGELATKLGYQNISYFSTVFRKIVGCSPNDYRTN